MPSESLFCNFLTQTMGYCGKYTGDGKCDKHKSLVETPRIQKGVKFRGDSKWQSENGMFNHK
jgi:hypothetical protein